MHIIRVRSKIGKNGLLQVQLPQAIEGEELDIILVYEPTVNNSTINGEFYGCIQDDTFAEIFIDNNVDRRAFMRLPFEERRRILAQQADEMIEHYQQDLTWQDWTSFGLEADHES